MSLCVTSLTAWTGSQSALKNVIIYLLRGIRKWTSFKHGWFPFWNSSGPWGTSFFGERRVELKRSIFENQRDLVSVREHLASRDINLWSEKRHARQADFPSMSPRKYMFIPFQYTCSTMNVFLKPTGNYVITFRILAGKSTGVQASKVCTKSKVSTFWHLVQP